MSRAETVATIALGALSVLPLVVRVDPNVNVILTASITVFVGCWRSVKPSAPATDEGGCMDCADGDDGCCPCCCSCPCHQRSTSLHAPRETMSKEHAMRFPFIGSAVLVSLFLLFKFLPKDLVNTVLTAYFVLLGILALSATILPWFEAFLPPSWNDDVVYWKVPYFKDLEIEFTWAQAVAAIPSTAFCAWYTAKKHWLANNALGLAFSIQGIEMLSLGSFKIGAILLVGLFFYDIFWVFFTPVMVTVAKSFDAPIKLLFPTGDATRPFSLLGLGDIVIPGIFVALALRFDVSRGKGLRYFLSSFAGYVAGLAVTIVVMNVFKAAQPALLYIVPGVMGFMGVHALVCGEVQQILEYEEAAAEEEEEGDEKEEKEKEKLEDKDKDGAPQRTPEQIAAAEAKGSKAD